MVIMLEGEESKLLFKEKNTENLVRKPIFLDVEAFSMIQQVVLLKSQALKNLTRP